MRKVLFFAALTCVGIGVANAAVRSTSSVSRTQSGGATTQNTAKTSSATSTQKISVRPAGATSQSGATRTTTGTASSRNAATVSSSRNAVTRRNVTRTTAARTARASQTDARSAIRNAITSISRTAHAPARAALAMSASQSNTFGTGYNACRDAYFTCMDQFCATQDDTYRRCVCSGKLETLKSRERTLAQTSSQLQDFHDLNIEVIPKTGAEVRAMLNATAGETIAAAIKDTSAGAQQLAGISEVLSGTKTKALSTQGTLDIAGDINAIWATTDLASGVQIANLTGTPLYNAVHSQCVDLISSKCTSDATLKMVVAAYAMYIENDCTTLAAAMDKKYTAAAAAIRETESQMHTARLENYDAHNSTSINDCIAQVRTDITADVACGPNYVHCLDVSGQYLNRTTGEPIYTPKFYQLENAVSLSGDVLNNNTNRILVAELNKKRTFAERGLETCRDLADDVWDEFMRQAIVEIYQGQQARVRQVRTECLDVVNACYDEKTKSLKDFSNIKETLLLGARLELSATLCQEKLYTCANLYGDVEKDGERALADLVRAMDALTDQKIAQECQGILRDFAHDLCRVPPSDSLHSYPYGCRTYAPSSYIYASMPQCRRGGDIPAKTMADVLAELTPPTKSDKPKIYSCPAITYISCNPGYYLSDDNGAPARTGVATECRKCQDGMICLGGTNQPVDGNMTECYDYANSLYEKMVQYAQQTCVQPSKSENDIPDQILQDVNVVMDSIRTEMSTALSRECERLGGIWVATAWNIGSSYPKYKRFYDETSAHTDWGYCADPNTELSATTAKLRNACESTCGDWNVNSSECTCSTKWGSPSIDINGRCVYSWQTSCQDSGGTWNHQCKTTTDGGNCKCPSPDYQVDAETHRCTKEPTNP